MTTELRDDRDRSEWLACLQVAPSVGAMAEMLYDFGTMPPDQRAAAGVARIADALFAEFRVEVVSKPTPLPPMPVAPPVCLEHRRPPPCAACERADRVSAWAIGLPTAAAMLLLVYVMVLAVARALR